MKDIFPTEKFKHKINKRNIRKYETKQINTKSFARLALPYNVKVLNKDVEENEKR